jgi:hypothetical protein
MGFPVIMLLVGVTGVRLPVACWGAKQLFKRFTWRLAVGQPTSFQRLLLSFASGAAHQPANDTTGPCLWEGLRL